MFRSYEAHYRPLPYGDSSVSVYTDEHGEAQVAFVPGFGFYFPGPNSNGGCDLRNVNPLGDAHVTVTARYPYQPVTPSDPSAAVDFTVTSDFDKSLRVLPKGGSADERYTRIVLAHAQDIDGSPLMNETVCWSANNLATGAITAFPTGPGGDIYASYLPDGTPVGPLWSRTSTRAGRRIRTTRSSTTGGSARRPTPTAIRRSSSASPRPRRSTSSRASSTRRSPVTSPRSFTAAALGELAGSGPVTSVPSPAQVKAAAAASASGAIAVGPVLADGTTVKSKVIKSAKLKKAVRKIALARVYKPFGGKRVLQVRVNGKNGMASLLITIKLGKKTHTYKRFVATNKQVAVKNLPIPAKTAKVTVSLVS